MRSLASRVLAAPAVVGGGHERRRSPPSANVDCELTFTMKGWSAFYKTASGTGTIKCSNGQSMNVKLSAKGGGLTVGKSTIEDGHGKFSAVAGMTSCSARMRRPRRTPAR